MLSWIGSGWAVAKIVDQCWHGVVKRYLLHGCCLSIAMMNVEKPFHGDGESLESYYSRFYKMMNELVQNQCHVTNHQVNVQFLLQLQPEWQRSQQSTRNRGKAIVTSSAPTYDPEPATVTEDEEMSKEKEIDKLMGFSLSLRAVNVAGARENVGTPVVQKSGIQCYNCKEYGYVSKGYNKWIGRYDTDDEALKNRIFGSYYMYMASYIQEDKFQYFSVSRPQLKSNHLEDRVMSNNSQGKKQELVEIILFIRDSGVLKALDRKPSQTSNLFCGEIAWDGEVLENDLIAPNSRLWRSVAFRKFYMYIRDLKGNDISQVLVERFVFHFVQDLNNPNPICNGSIKLHRSKHGLASFKGLTEFTSVLTDPQCSRRPMFNELLNGTSHVLSKSSAVYAADNPDKRQQHNTTHTSTTTDVADLPPLNIHSNSNSNSQYHLSLAPDNISQAGNQYRKIAQFETCNGDLVINLRGLGKTNVLMRKILFCNKSRLVAKGFAQRDGWISMIHSAPVARWKLYGGHLAYACTQIIYHVYQCMDVKTAFLYGPLKEEVSQIMAFTLIKYLCIAEFKGPANSHLVQSVQNSRTKHIGWQDITLKEQVGRRHDSYELFDFQDELEDCFNKYWYPTYTVEGELSESEFMQYRGGSLLQPPITKTKSAQIESRARSDQIILPQNIDVILKYFTVKDGNPA
ncbi:hypothetical protein Tco_0429554 [Tanacetum coccineum]